MKKRIGILIFIMVTVFAVLSAIAQAADSELELDSINSEAITFSSTASGENALYAAVYKDNVLKSIVKSDGDKITVPILSMESDSEYTFKALCWDKDGIVPQSAPLNVNIVEAEAETIGNVDAAAKTVKVFNKDKRKMQTVQLAEECQVIINRASGHTSDELLEILEQGSEVRYGRLLFADPEGDGIFDIASADYYGTAVVYGVVKNSKEEATKITFIDQGYGINKTSLSLNKENTEYSLIYNGEPIEAKDLQENDVLSIVYDYTAGFADSDYYYIEVSREKITGTYEGRNTDGTIVTIDGSSYPTDASMGLLYFEEGVPFECYFDVFGRISYNEEIEIPKNLGILKYVYRLNNGDYAVDIFDREGKCQNYKMDYGSSTSGGAMQVAETFGGNTVDSLEYTSGLANIESGADYLSQVVEYRVNTSGKLTIVQFYTNYTGGDYSAAYRASSNRIGNIKISDEAVILDLTGVSQSRKDNINIITKDMLKDGCRYSAAGYDRSSMDAAYRFVLITDGIGGYDSDTQLAVFCGLTPAQNEQGDDVVQLTVLENGEQRNLTVNDDETAAQNTALSLVEGEPIIYATDFSGEITEICRVFKSGIMPGSEDFSSFRARALSEDILNTELPDLTDGRVYSADISFGVLIKEDTAGGYALAAPTEEDGRPAVDIWRAESMNTGVARVYTYNFSLPKTNHYRLSTDDSLIRTPEIVTAYKNADSAQGIYYLDDPNVYDYIVFAVVRTVDGEVQEIYQFISE